jgi:NADPH:quinone reductase-like Zn-dependent oxidoreductase
MLALQQIGLGTVEEALRLADAPTAAPGPHDIAVDIEVAPIHVSDLLALEGRSMTPLGSFPRVPGVEAVGRVVAVGDQVRDFTVGARVFAPKWAGAFRQRLIARADQCYAAPEAVDAAQLSILSTMGLTAWLVLEDYVARPYGGWLVQNGASSSIARLVIGMAKARGLRTANIVRRVGLDNALKALGADAVIVDEGDEAQLQARVREACGGEVPTVALDVLGGVHATRLIHTLADGGSLVLYGASSGAQPVLDFMALGRRDIRVRGMGMSACFNRRDAAGQRAIFAELGRLAETGAIRTEIAARFTLERYREAFALAALPQAERRGKVLFTPNG